MVMIRAQSNKVGISCLPSLVHSASSLSFRSRESVSTAEQLKYILSSSPEFVMSCVYRLL